MIVYRKRNFIIIENEDNHDKIVLNENLIHGVLTHEGDVHVALTPKIDTPEIKFEKQTAVDFMNVFLGD